MSIDNLVSVGVPVFNEGRYIEAAIRSLLDQSYSNIEIIISDNGSEDRTVELCEKFAHIDNRVKLFKQKTNIGGFNNFQFVRNQAIGKYFMWAGAHDLWDKNFIQKSIELMEKDLGIVNVYPRTHEIDEDATFIREWPDNIETRGLDDALDRYKKIVWEMANVNSIYGVFRSETLNKLQIEEVLMWDNVTIASLALEGEMVLISEPLFFRRRVREIENRAQRYIRVQDALKLKPAKNIKKLTRTSVLRQARKAHVNVLLRSNALTHNGKMKALTTTYLAYHTKGAEIPFLNTLIRFLRPIGRPILRYIRNK